MTCDAPRNRIMDKLQALNYCILGATNPICRGSVLLQTGRAPVIRDIVQISFGHVSSWPPWYGILWVLFLHQDRTGNSLGLPMLAGCDCGPTNHEMVMELLAVTSNSEAVTL